MRRISVGGALARVAWGAMLRVAEEIKQGRFDGLGSAASGKSSTGFSVNSRERRIRETCHCAAGLGHASAYSALNITKASTSPSLG